MGLCSGYQLASHLRTVVKSITSRRSAVLLVLPQGPLAVKQIIALVFESVPKVPYLALKFESLPRQLTCSMSLSGLRRMSKMCFIFGIFHLEVALTYPLMKVLAPQRLGEDILSRVTVRLLRSNQM